MANRNKIKFNVVERTSDECVHDTGVIHSLGIKCEDVENMMTAYAIREDDPDHERIWHNEKTNPYLIKLEV